MKDTNNIATYLTKHDSLVTAATLICFRGADSVNHNDRATADYIKKVNSIESNNRYEEK